jgi:hypothetical protein
MKLATQEKNSKRAVNARTLNFRELNGHELTVAAVVFGIAAVLSLVFRSAVRDLIAQPLVNLLGFSKMILRYLGQYAQLVVLSICLLIVSLRIFRKNGQFEIVSAHHGQPKILRTDPVNKAAASRSLQWSVSTLQVSRNQRSAYFVATDLRNLVLEILADDQEQRDELVAKARKNHVDAPIEVNQLLAGEPEWLQVPRWITVPILQRLLHASFFRRMSLVDRLSQSRRTNTYARMAVVVRFLESLQNGYGAPKQLRKEVLNNE